MKADRRGWKLRRAYREQFQSRRTTERADAFIGLTSLLYTTLVRFCQFCFRIFSTGLSIFGAVDKKDWTKPETFVVRCVLFAYALCSSVSGIAGLTRVKPQCTDVWWVEWVEILTQWVHNECISFFLRTANAFFKSAVGPVSHNIGSPQLKGPVSHNIGFAQFKGPAGPNII